MIILNSSRYFLGSAAALALGALVASPAVLAQAMQTVRIGHAAPLSGTAAHWGKDNENGVRLAIEGLNVQKLVIGGKVTQFELMSLDDQGDPKQAVSVAHQMVDSNVKAMLGHFNSGAAIPASSIYSRASVVNLSTATNPGFTAQGFTNVFRVLASDTDVGAVMSEFTIKELKAKRVALIDDRTAYGKGSAEDFGARIKAMGAEVVAHEYTSDKSTDFSPILTTLRSKNPDVIFYGGMDAQGGLIARQMVQLGVKAKLLGSDGLCTDAIVKISGGAVNGVLYCTRGGQALEQRPRGAAFAQQYKSRFNTEVLAYGPFLYDAMMVVAAAMKKADSVEPAKYLPMVRDINYEGITNAFNFDAKGNLKNPTVTAYFYKDNTRTQVLGK